MQPVGSSVYAPPPPEQPRFNLAEMLEKAREFAEIKDSSGECGILEYIEGVLKNEEFQRNPKDFLRNWDKKRGYTEEFRCTEDNALIFIKNNFI